MLRHVRIERFEISHRYRTGWVTVEPQLSVDATERQITADRTLAALPPSLQSVSLFEYGGEVVGANRGMIEFDDLLKRPLEHYKYLLTTVERAALSLTSATLFLDLVFIGSCNDIHLAAFREIPDFQSFKGRIELVRVPFILDVRHEEALYRERLREAAGRAPHRAAHRVRRRAVGGAVAHAQAADRALPVDARRGDRQAVAARQGRAVRDRAGARAT